MKQEALFKGKLFGGFRRKDVMDYIEQTHREMTDEQRTWQAKLNVLEQELAQAREDYVTSSQEWEREKAALEAKIEMLRGTTVQPTSKPESAPPFPPTQPETPPLRENSAEQPAPQAVAPTAEVHTAAAPQETPNPQFHAMTPQLIVAEAEHPTQMDDPVPSADELAKLIEKYADANRRG